MEDGQEDVPISHQQNGGGRDGRTEESERQEISAAPRRARREEGTAAPWRQRGRNRRETIACTPVRSMPEQDAPQEKRPCQTEPQEQTLSSVGNSLRMTGRVQ